MQSTIRIFSQLLSFVPRHLFHKLSQEHKPLRTPRTFSQWDHFIHLLHIQLAGCKSLRNGVMSMKAHIARLYHLGTKPVARSTFADANNSRPYTFYEALFGELFTRCRPKAPGHKFSFKNTLYSLDASVIDLCLKLFPWADFRSSKAGVKLHALLDHNGDLPAMVNVTVAKQHEITVAKKMELPPGSIVVFDRGYNDYGWFKDLTKKGVFFVTRIKAKATFKILERNQVDKTTGVTSDQFIQFGEGEKAQVLRLVGYRDAKTNRHFVYITNHMALPARTIADIYKARWEIEIFFRFIKQNLKIKRFVGNSKNAVLSQIYVALIACLLLAFQKFMSKTTLSIQDLTRLIQNNLFHGTEILEYALSSQKSKNKCSFSMLQLPC